MMVESSKRDLAEFWVIGLGGVTIASWGVAGVGFR